MVSLSLRYKGMGAYCSSPRSGPRVRGVLHAVSLYNCVHIFERQDALWEGLLERGELGFVLAW